MISMIHVINMVHVIIRFQVANMVNAIILHRLLHTPRGVSWFCLCSFLLFLFSLIRCYRLYGNLSVKNYERLSLSQHFTSPTCSEIIIDLRYIVLPPSLFVKMYHVSENVSWTYRSIRRFLSYVVWFTVWKQFLLWWMIGFLA